MNAKSAATTGHKGAGFLINIILNEVNPIVQIKNHYFFVMSIAF